MKGFGLNDLPSILGEGFNRIAIGAFLYHRYFLYYNFNSIDTRNWNSGVQSPITELGIYEWHLVTMGKAYDIALTFSLWQVLHVLIGTVSTPDGEAPKGRLPRDITSCVAIVLLTFMFVTFSSSLSSAVSPEPQDSYISCQLVMALWDSHKMAKFIAIVL